MGNDTKHTECADSDTGTDPYLCPDCRIEQRSCCALEEIERFLWAADRELIDPDEAVHRIYLLAEGAFWRNAVESDCDLELVPDLFQHLLDGDAKVESRQRAGEGPRVARASDVNPELTSGEAWFPTPFVSAEEQQRRQNHEEVIRDLEAQGH